MAAWSETWSDIAADLAAVVPADVPVVRVEDAWIARKYAEGSRVRAIDVAAGADSEPLLAQARDRARTAGWKQIHREDADRQDVFRRTVRTLVKSRPQFLRAWPVEVGYPRGTLRAVRVDFEQGCPWPTMAPHVVGRSGHKLVRDTWGINAPVRSTRLELLADPDDVATAAVIRETIEIVTTDVAGVLTTHGLAAVDGAPNRFARTERYTKGALTTAASIGEETTTVLLELDRSSRLR